MEILELEIFFWDITIPNHKLYTYPQTEKNQTPFNIIHPSNLPFTLPETNIAPENGWLED